MIVHAVAVGHRDRWVFMEKAHLAEKLKNWYIGGGGHIRMHMFMENWERLKLTTGYFICIIRAVSSPGSQYAKSILEPDIQGMKLLCEVMERTVN